MMKRGRVPAEWKCHILKKTQRAKPEAVFHARYGWICDCGRWVRDNDNQHTIIKREEREVYME